MARSLNKVILIGNLTRDVELRYTPQGSPVAIFGLATNRQWKVGDQIREATEFHNIIAWNKLAELCSQLLVKGSRVYVEGRIQSRDWVDATGAKRKRVEIVIDEMIYLGGRSKMGASVDSIEESANIGGDSGVEEEVVPMEDLSELDIDEAIEQSDEQS